MTEITAGELLIQCFKAENIEMLFGIIDGAHIPFVVHAPKYGIRHINCRHEEAAVHLAEGYARIAGKPSVVFGSPGPGGANMLAGLTRVSIYLTGPRPCVRSGAWTERSPPHGP